jgi:hypothetical protein
MMTKNTSEPAWQFRHSIDAMRHYSSHGVSGQTSPTGIIRVAKGTHEFTASTAAHVFVANANPLPDKIGAKEELHGV